MIFPFFIDVNMVDRTMWNAWNINW